MFAELTINGAVRVSIEFHVPSVALQDPQLQIRFNVVLRDVLAFLFANAH